MSHKNSRKSLFSSFKTSILWSFLFCALMLCTTRGNAAITATQSVYEDALAAGWENWSWGTSVNFGVTAQKQAGTKSIGITFNDAWSGFYLHNAGLSVAGYTHLQFWINGGASGNQTIFIYAEDATGRPPVQVPLNKYVTGGVVAANAWRFVSVPLSDLALGSQTLTGLTWQNATSGAQSLFYLDTIRLVKDSATPTPTPTATPTPRPTVTPQPTPTGTPAGPIPPVFGKNMMLGLSNLPSDYPWLAQSGIPWSARYTYLTGGANTANNWTNWNSPAGQYATYYLNDSAKSNCLPVFTYYQILAANPRSYDETLPAFQEKFANAACMKSYYDDFKLLMQKCAAFGKPVLVHVEPDTWGYMMLTKSSPALYPVKVATSGHADAVGLPNTAVGFAKMLVNLRDKYAPNVKLSLHASVWCAGTDVSLNTDASYDIKANAERTGKWLNALGGGWNVVFVDVADRDAAYKQIVRGQNTWWDEADLRLPNFAQVALWITYLNRIMNRRVIVWQIPVGNTKMRSCNNAWGHYQDNRVQYFFDAAYGQNHLNAWANAGVIGLLFGRGDGNTTTNTDAAGDGITNPAAINGNTRTATFADDDGGYFRERAAAYFKAPLRLPGVP